MSSGIYIRTDYHKKIMSFETLLRNNLINKYYLKSNLKNIWR